MSHINILATDETGSENWLYAMGHLDREEFARQAGEQYGVGEIPATEVEHTYLRETQAKPVDGVDVWLHRCKPSAMGAYPVTLVALD